MSMLTRTGTIIRKDRRRSITKYTRDRRGSAPMILSENYMQCPRGRVGLTRTAALRLDRDLKRISQVASPARCVNVSTDMSWFDQDTIDPAVLLQSNSAAERGGAVSATIPDDTPKPSKCETVHEGDENEHKEHTVVQIYSPVDDSNKRQHYDTPTSGEHRFCFEDRASPLIDSLQEANLESVSAWHFVLKAFRIVSNTLGFTVLLSLFLIMPITMLSVGATYLHECPVEPKIPIYLLVGGCFLLAKIIMTLWSHLRIKKHGIISGSDMSYDDRGISAMFSITQIAISLFLVIWFVLGNVWVFGQWQPNYKPLLQEPRNWCTRTVFMFAFWKIIVCYIVLLFVVILGGLFCGCHLCMVYLRNKESDL